MLDDLLRGASDLFPAEPPFEGVNALIMPKRDLQVPSIYALPATSFRVQEIPHNGAVYRE